MATPRIPAMKGSRLRSARAKPNRIRFASYTVIADVDVVATGGKIASGVDAKGDIRAAGCIKLQCFISHGRIVQAAGIGRERAEASRRIVIAIGVVRQRFTNGRVEAADRVCKERVGAGGRVVVTDRIAIKR